MVGFKLILESISTLMKMVNAFLMDGKRSIMFGIILKILL